MIKQDMSVEFEPLTFLPLYVDTMEKVEYLTDEEVGRLTRLLLRYAATGVTPTANEMPGREQLVFVFFREDVDRGRASYFRRCMANRRNGKKGGRPPKQAKKTQETQEQGYEQGQYHDQEQKHPQEQTPGPAKDLDHTQDHIQDHPKAGDVVAKEKLMPAIYVEPEDFGLPL